MSVPADHSEDTRLQRAQEILASGAEREDSRPLRSLAPAGTVPLTTVTDLFGFPSFPGPATVFLI